MQSSEAVEAGLKLLDILTDWSTVTLILVLTFRKPLRSGVASGLSVLARRMSKASVAGASLEFSQDIAVQALKETLEVGVQERAPGEAAQFVLDQVGRFLSGSQHNTPQPLAAKSILWVDDRPTNVAYETNVLKILGARVIGALSTREALELVRDKKYDLIISDLHRDEDGEDVPTAGRRLITALRSKGDKTPVIFYTLSSTTPEAQKLTKEFGAPVADLSENLINEIISAIGEASDSWTR